MAEAYDVFLSYSRNDLNAAALLRAQLERAGLAVFKDDAEHPRGRAVARAPAAGGGRVRRFRRAGRQGRRAALDRRRDAGRPEPLLRAARRRRAPADLSDPARRDEGRGAAGVPEAVPGDAVERRRSAAGRTVRTDLLTNDRRQKGKHLRGLPLRRPRRLPHRTRRICSSAGRRRRWTRSPASTAVPAFPRCGGWRSPATPARANRR